MNTNELIKWCATYKRAWEQQDPVLFVALFTTDCQYRVSPFAEPVPGRVFDAFWRALAQRQRDNHIEMEILGWTSGSRAIVRWDAQTTRSASGERLMASGIFLLTFADGERCSDVLEWQHAHPVGTPFPKPEGMEHLLATP